MLFLGNIGTTEIIIIALIILLLFGGRKIPEMMRGIGKGIRSFKEGMKDINEETAEFFAKVDHSNLLDLLLAEKVILVDKNNKAVDVEKSYVKITKTDDESILKVNLKDSEKEGGLTSTVIAKDGIAVIVNNNCPAEDLKSEDIMKAFTGEVTEWSEIYE